MSLKNPKAEHEEVINHAEDYSEPTQAPAQVPAVAQPTGQVAVYQDEEDHFGPRTVKEASGYFEKVGFEYDPAMAAGCAVISGKVLEQQDLGTHTLFIAEITDAKLLNENAPLTYADYQNRVKPKKKEIPQDKKIVGWRCKICNYVYEGSELPADYICPICGHDVSDFEPIFEN